jgi:hypothetical protein
MITLIYNIEKIDDRVTVEAVVEDAVQTYSATLYDPPEYGPALCTASFCLDEDEILPSDDEQLIDYLEQMNLDWEPIKNDNDFED